MDYHGITMRGDFETDNIKALSSTGIKFYDDDDNERASLSDAGIFQITTVDINGGYIDATPIGSGTPSTGAFTTATANTLTANTLTATNIKALSSTGIKFYDDDDNERASLSDAGIFQITTVDINGGYIDATPIGSSSISTGAFTTVTANTLTATTVNATTFDTNVAAAGMTIYGNTFTADGTDTNIDINMYPKGSGEVNILKADIDGGSIDNTTVGFSGPSTGKFSTIEATSLKLFDATTVTHISKDTSLAENSDSYLATQKAIKYYIDNQSVLFTNLGDGPGGYSDARAIYTVNSGGNGIDESGVILTPGTNTFSIVRGTAGLDIAAGASLDVNYNLTVSGSSNIDQDIRKTASPTLANLTLSTGIPTLATQVGNLGFNDARYLAFKTITDGVTSIDADSYQDTLTLADSTGITVSVGETDTVTFTLATGLQQISALTQTNNYVIIGNGTSWTTADIGALTMDVSVQRGTIAKAQAISTYNSGGIQYHYCDITISEIDEDKSFVTLNNYSGLGSATESYVEITAELTGPTTLRIRDDAYTYGGRGASPRTTLGTYVVWEIVTFT